MRESLRKENNPLENLGKVHHTVKWQKIYFITFGLILQKASFDPKILKKNQPRHVFFKMTGSAISRLALTMSAAYSRFTSIANIARENHSAVRSQLVKNVCFSLQYKSTKRFASFRQKEAQNM